MIKLSETIGKRVVSLRKKLSLTQTVFGEKINVTKSQIGNIENDRRILTDRTISDICREFNVNEDWLRYGKEPMFRPAKTIDNELTIEIVKLIGTDDEFTKQCILQYLKLSDQSKAMFKDFLVSVVDGCRKDGENIPSDEENQI